ncbi:uncharacterized protein EDB93DRAFT_1247974 [Suillus bovinus]|uniref:uncharacterized protein n=1 Tax=Suillus bovinus TaxID=48563 RepID=UPI001B879659|nr:uncharacterized protein EDB93DRAFT_1247974 [Suillus bovinus]KAG2155019.1 hypothetical protein EDB93DRAFT_1247974 [Suillus bovinus]
MTLHHPDEPYPMDKVYEAAVFLLPGTVAVVATSIPLRTTSQAPRTSASTVPMMQPSGSVVVKQEYNLQNAQYECYFCGGWNHIARYCSHHREYITSGRIIETDGKVFMPDDSRIPGGREDRSMKQQIDTLASQSPATGANTIQVQAGLYFRAALDIEIVAEIDSSAFMHTRSEPLEDEEEFEQLERIQLANQGYAVFTAKHAKKTNKGKGVRFDGVDVSSRPRLGPSSKTSKQTEEIASPQVKEAKTGKAPNPRTSVLKPATKAPIATPATASSSQAPQYRYVFLLEDKDTEKRVIDKILDTDVSLPIRDIIAASPDIWKAIKDLTMSKRVTVGAVLVNELSSLPRTDQFLRDWEEHMKRAEDGRIVADHFKALRCIRGITRGGQVLSCVLDQGAEVIVMLQAVWRSLGGVPLRSDYQMTMESVNTSMDSTLGVMENFPLDFRTGDMMFQVQIVPMANFDILLGRPFFTLTSCLTTNLPNGDQDVTLTDPNTGKIIRIPMEPWTRKCAKCRHNMLCVEHPSPKGF